MTSMVGFGLKAGVTNRGGVRSVDRVTNRGGARSVGRTNPRDRLRRRAEFAAFRTVSVNGTEKVVRVTHSSRRH